MNLVIDSNIFISGLITPNGTISKLIMKDLIKSQIICPDFLYNEVNDKLDKIKKITQFTDSELKDLIQRFTRKIVFIDNDLIEFTHQKQAYQLVKNVDKKDLLFVALSLQTNFPLWTGDKKLISGLKEKGFYNTILTTELLKWVNDNS